MFGEIKNIAPKIFLVRDEEIGSYCGVRFLVKARRTTEAEDGC